MDFRETQEQAALRNAVAELGKRYGHDYAAPKARAREPLLTSQPAAKAISAAGMFLDDRSNPGLSSVLMNARLFLQHAVVARQCSALSPPIASRPRFFWSVSRRLV